MLNQSSERTFFLSQSAQYLYYLTKLDGKTRTKKLNVTKFHYENKAYAALWFQQVRDIIIQFPEHEDFKEGLKQLTDLYRNMTNY